MVFAHDTAAALGFAVELVNTLPDPTRGIPDRLATRADLDALMEPWEWTGRPAGDDNEFAAVCALRPRLKALWTAPIARQAEGVNALLREAGALPQLVIHGNYGWHIHATDPQAPVAERMAVEAAMALVDVIRLGETERLRLCAADDCGDLVLDLSKNRSRRYCNGTCGNRANVAAYRQRLLRGGRTTR